jgi:hypothetical protein
MRTHDIPPREENTLMGRRETLVKQIRAAKKKADPVILFLPDYGMPPDADPLPIILGHPNRQPTAEELAAAIEAERQRRRDARNPELQSTLKPAQGSGDEEINA